MGVKLFGGHFPEWFGHLGRAMFSLFQIMTLESWSMGIARPIMAIYPYAWLYFIPFILISAFTLLNFLIGIVVDALAYLKSSEEREAEQIRTDELLRRLDRIEKLLENKK
ncbi:Ion transport protein [Piscirickettsia salmonis]|nr:Ion transport protein [Piscirickettsia salmonis]QGP57672.1 Ion transport protein [Piscirickettsia salmonis]QGP62377.1 Ion transport protein [Piscirickettsia salmonis]